MTIYDFVVLAINKAKADALAKGKEFKGIHTVYSGLNEDIRVLFGEGITGNVTVMKKGVATIVPAIKQFPITAIDELCQQGKLEKHYAFGGAMVYLKGEMPVMRDKPTSKADVLKKYGLTPPPVIAPKAKASKAIKAI